MKKYTNQTRLLLFLAFGGMLLLLLAVGVNGLSILNSIQRRNDQIRNDYVQRNRILEQLRSNIYLSGTYVRDLLLEPNPTRADLHRRELERSHEQINSLIARYNAILRPEEQSPFSQFRRGLHAFFDSLQPALNWDALQRKTMGYRFMQDLLLPQRMVIVHLADQLQEVNEKQLAVSTRHVGELFAQFRTRLMLLLILTSSGGLFLAGFSFRRIIRLERETADRFTETVEARTALRDLSSRLVEVQENERKSIARELHDEVGQSLSGILLGIANLAAILRSAPSAETEREIQKLRRLAERTVATVRDLSLLLRPSMLDDLGLVPALQWQAREVSRNSGLNVTVTAESIPEDLSDEAKTCIYRLVQEALRNVVRHAHATEVKVQLIRRERQLLLTVEDNGRGFEADREKGLGLLGMEERVKHLGGLFDLQSSPGGGSKITAEIPFSSEREAIAV